MQQEMTQAPEPQAPIVRSKVVDYKYVIGLVLAALIGYWQTQVNSERRIAELESRASIAPEMRNREADDTKARIASIEAYLREHCGTK